GSLLPLGAKRPEKMGLLRSPAGASSLATVRCLLLTDLFQIEAAFIVEAASMYVWRRLRPDSNSLMKD
ncbi:hypothetical protein, partial [Pseudomonas sp. Ant30-3]|uniref:hypothetical protein n=1 Tax=Pseudomonas sp. Ant30-3 TaxID=1488328 RepID=UPI001F2ACC79